MAHRLSSASYPFLHDSISDFLFYDEPFFFNHIDYLSHILFAKLVRRRFNHDTDYRFRSTFTDKDSSVISKCFCNCIDCFDHFRILPCCLLICHTHIFQKLWIDLHFFCQLSEGLFGLHDNFHQHQRSQNTISCRRMLTENNMSGLFTAQHESILDHVLIDIFVADLCLFVLLPILSHAL